MSRGIKAPSPSITKSSSSAPLSWKERIHSEDYEQLRATFQLFDEDHSGTIDPEEINKILEELGPERRIPLIYSIIDGLKNKNKPITFEQFIESVAPRIGDVKTKEGLKTVFAHIDKDNDGVLDFEELKIVSRMVGDNINDDDLLEMLHSTHINRLTQTNESINFDEFYQIVTKFYKK